MKKTAIASFLLLSAFSVGALAQNSGFYVQGDLGYSNLRLGEDTSDVSLNKSVFDQRISLGYALDTGSVSPRFAVDYTNFGKATYNGGDYDTNLSVKIRSLGLSAFADFKTSSEFTPYVGLRISSNEGKADINSQGYYGYYGYHVSRSESESETSVGIGLLGGVQYKLSDKLDLNLGVEYNRLFEDVNQFGAKVGLRYNF